jgi:hypothetical protein
VPETAHNYYQEGVMLRPALAALLIVSANLLGCGGKTVLVQVPPRMDMKAYETTGIIEFASNADTATNQHATQEFQRALQSAQPGTRFIDLGAREAVLAAVGSRELDVEAVRKIGRKYGVAAIFHGNIIYSDPSTDIRVTDLSKLQGGVKAEIKGDMFGRLLETRTGASVWSSSAWARRPLLGVVSGEHGVSVAMNGNANPRYEMVPALVRHLTVDFRAATVRQKVE